MKGSTVRRARAPPPWHASGSTSGANRQPRPQSKSPVRPPGHGSRSPDTARPGAHAGARLLVSGSSLGRRGLGTAPSASIAAAAAPQLLASTSRNPAAESRRSSASAAPAAQPAPRPAPLPEASERASASAAAAPATASEAAPAPEPPPAAAEAPAPAAAKADEEPPELRALREEEAARVRAVLRGDFAAARDEGHRKTALFLSSTFADTAAERNHLAANVFPRLRGALRELGLGFSVVDLRWGIADTGTDNHEAWDVCLRELRRCAAESSGLAFVYFGAERYGWRALPKRVEAGEMEVLLAAVEGDEARATVARWYRRDENAVPPEYVLQAISTVGEPFWGEGGAQERMQAALRGAAERADLPAADRSKYFASITELEVEAGLLSRPPAERAAACAVVLRRFAGGAGAAEAPAFFTPEGEDRRRLEGLLAAAEAAAPPGRLRKFEVPWLPGGVHAGAPEHAAYLRELGEFVEGACLQAARGAVAGRRAPLPVESEASAHAHFAARRAGGFCGRGALLEALRGRARGGCVTVLVGRSGAGKTSLVARLAADASDACRRDGRGLVLARFCGTTPDASAARALLRSLSLQLDAAAGSDPPEAAKELAALRDELRSRLAQHASAERPVHLFVDSLDQLEDEGGERAACASWLPLEPIPHVSVLVSTLPESLYGCLPSLAACPALSPADFFELEPLGPEDTEAILEGFLRRARRALQPAQRAALLAAARGPGAPGTALHLRLLAEEYARLASGEPAEGLPASVPDLIAASFARVEAALGPRLVSRALGLLTASARGLSEAELEDILSTDEEVLTDVLKFHQPPVRRLPPFVTALFRFALGEHLVSRGADGEAVLFWYHRQFWEAAAARYLPDDAARARSGRAIAEYFLELAHGKFPDRGLAPQPLWLQGAGGAPNLRRLSEVPRAIAAVPDMAPLVPGVRAELQDLAAAVVRAVEGERARAEEAVQQIEGLVRELERCSGVLEGRRTELEAMRAEVQEYLDTCEPWERAAKADAASISPQERDSFMEVVAFAKPPAGVTKTMAALMLLLRPDALGLDTAAAYRLFREELAQRGWPDILASLHAFDPRRVRDEAVERLGKLYLGDPELDEKPLARVSSVTVKVMRYVRAMEKYCQLYMRAIRPKQREMAKLEGDMEALGRELRAAGDRMDAARAARRRTELELEGLQVALELASAKRALLDAELGGAAGA